VDDLLVIPELDQHRLRIDSQPVFLWDVLQQATYGLSSQQRERLNYSRIQDALQEELAVLGDADRLEQVLINLLENACKYSFTPEDTVHIWMQEASDTHLELWIQNTCHPFDEALLPSLFDKFKRLDAGLQRTTRGSGLGLYISQALIQAMQAELTLHLRPIIDSDTGASSSDRCYFQTCLRFARATL
jgi:signal transduction histidine kinase